MQVFCGKIKGSLERFRDFTYIDDCVNLLFKSLKSNKFNEVYNLTSGKKCKVKQLVKLLIKLFKKKKDYSIQVAEGTKGDSFGFHSSNKKIVKHFKYNFQFSLEKGLKNYVKWISSVPNTKKLERYHPLKQKKLH